MYTDVSEAIADRIDAEALITLPVVFENDNGEGLDLSLGFLGVSVDFKKATHASINWPHPKVRYFGTITIYINTPINVGPSEGVAIADVVHTLFSGRVFDGIHCFIGFIDSRMKIKYAKGEYWSTPFVCNFYIEEHLTVA
jgi:hypothetical protein